MPNNSTQFTPKGPLSYSKSDIIKEIQRVINDECKGVVPSQAKFLRLAKISKWTIRTKFGTYAQAIQEAGFIYEDNRSKFTTERVKAELCKMLNRNDGYYFTYSFYRQNGGAYSLKAIKSILKSPDWANVMQIIGAKQKPYILKTTAHAQRIKMFANLTESDLFREIRRVWEKKGRRPTYSEFRKASQFGIKIYETRYGSWVNALESYCSTHKISVQGKARTH